MITSSPTKLINWSTFSTATRILLDSVFDAAAATGLFADVADATGALAGSADGVTFPATGFCADVVCSTWLST